MKNIFLVILFSLNLFSQNRLYIFDENKKKGLVDENGIIKLNAEFDKIIDFGQNNWTNTRVYLLSKNNKIGLMNYYGNWIYQLEYDGIECRNDTCKLIKAKKQGYGDIKGNLIIPTKYDKLGKISDQKISALVNGKWGYLNLKNEWIIAPQFDNSKIVVGEFYEGLAKIYSINQQNSCGYINEKGQLVIPQIYDIYNGNFHNGLAKIYENNKMEYINKEGKIAFESNWEYNTDSDFKNGIAEVTIRCKQYDDYGVCIKTLINTKGEIILPKNCILSGRDSNYNYIVISDTISKKEGVIDNKGKIIVPINFENINFLDDVNLFSVTNYFDYNELVGFYSKSGEKITECKYKICGRYRDDKDLFICIEQGNARGVLDKKGNEILFPKYGNVKLADDVFVVDNSVYTYIGQSISPSCGYFKKDGIKLFEKQYSFCSEFNDGLAVVLDENQGWKIIDKQNTVLTLIGKKYNSISQFSNHRAIVSIDGKSYGLIDKNGKLVVPLVYDYIYNYNDVIEVSKNKKYGLINPDGKIILPIIFDSVSIKSCNNKVYGSKNGKTYWFDMNGKPLSDKVPFAQCH